MQMLSSGIFSYLLANYKLIFNISSVMEGQNSRISNLIKTQWVLFSNTVSHFVTLVEFFHWFTFRCCTITFLFFFSFCLLTSPVLLLSNELIKMVVETSGICGFVVTCGSRCNYKSTTKKLCQMYQKSFFRQLTLMNFIFFFFASLGITTLSQFIFGYSQTKA